MIRNEHTIQVLTSSTLLRGFTHTRGPQPPVVIFVPNVVSVVVKNNGIGVAVGNVVVAIVIVVVVVADVVTTAATVLSLSMMSMSAWSLLSSWWELVFTEVIVVVSVIVTGVVGQSGTGRLSSSAHALSWTFQLRMAMHRDPAVLVRFWAMFGQKSRITENRREPVVFPAASSDINVWWCRHTRSGSRGWLCCRIRSRCGAVVVVDVVVVVLS